MTTSERLVDKAKEAFVMAIEIYNKPSINYRLEGFSFFICNAWELMLKAHMINKFGEQSIYYSDKPNRTISLQPQYSYSQQAIDFIFDEIKKAPSTILDDLKEKNAKK